MSIDPILLRYAAGEISAMRAADLMGPGFTVADVVVGAKQAGLPPPEPPEAQQRRERAHARRVLGLPQRDEDEGAGPADGHGGG